MYTVGSVPYANAKPLVWWLGASAGPVRVVYAVPSQLPAMLDSGAADAVLASSYEALITPGRRIASGLCIASEGPVRSVRLFSKVPFGEIQVLALDRSSMTSNALAGIILAERYHVRPKAIAEEPSLEGMLGMADAAVLIGDKGMSASGDGLHEMDLGEAWTDLTDLPFVWAMWMSGDGLTTELVRLLQDAWREFDGARLDGRQGQLVEQFALEAGWTPATMEDYLLRTIKFELGKRELEGLREFQRRLILNGDLEAIHFPTVVESGEAVTSPA